MYELSASKVDLKVSGVESEKGINIIKFYDNE